jgi:hypothetical protein
LAQLSGGRLDLQNLIEPDYPGVLKIPKCSLAIDNYELEVAMLSYNEIVVTSTIIINLLVRDSDFKVLIANENQNWPVGEDLFLQAITNRDLCPTALYQYR